MLTAQTLVDSKEFKDWIGDDQVRLIHNPYFDSETLPAFIVVHSDKEDGNKFSITRFWQSPNRKDQLDKIHVSVDHKSKTVDEVFQLLLSDYSKGLD
jgi:hypothetical protein